MARRIALAALALTLATLVAPGRGDAAETIKVGFMAPLSGIFAQAGKDMLEASGSPSSRSATSPPGGRSS